VFGYSVSLSDDAKTFAVGAPYANGKNGDDTGRVRIYRTDDYESGWTQIGEDIDGEAAYETSGVSISLSAVRRWLSALIGMMTTALPLVT
jgi:hypothetical protein